jgi:hypothetical protein
LCHTTSTSRDPYYLRITANGDANSGAQIQIADDGPLVDQRRVVDPSFLEVVRLGVKSALDPGVRSTLPVVDRELRYGTANGPFWHRSSFDGYGEKRDGSQWEPVEPGSRETLGRGWPLQLLASAGIFLVIGLMTFKLALLARGWWCAQLTGWGLECAVVAWFQLLAGVDQGEPEGRIDLA